MGRLQWDEGGYYDGYHSFVILCIPRWPLVLTISSKLWRTSQEFTRHAPHLMKPGVRHLFTSICEPDVYNVHNSSQTEGGGVRNAFPSFFPTSFNFHVFFSPVSHSKCSQEFEIQHVGIR